MLILHLLKHRGLSGSALFSCSILDSSSCFSSQSLPMPLSSVQECHFHCASFSFLADQTQLFSLILIDAPLPCFSYLLLQPCPLLLQHVILLRPLWLPFLLFLCSKQSSIILSSPLFSEEIPEVFLSNPSFSLKSRSNILSQTLTDQTSETL